MKISSLESFELANVDWGVYDLILLASGFEERSVFLLGMLPQHAIPKCVTLGFFQDRDKLSRRANDAAYAARGLVPFIADSSLAYEEQIRQALLAGARHANGQSLKIFIDYSVMTRAWYGYLLTWLKYSGDVAMADVDFVYAHGEYLAEFSPLRIEEMAAIEGFEGVCAGSRRTVAFLGLGYDRYATLAVHELIEPDSVVCYAARDAVGDLNSLQVLRQNTQILEMCGCEPVYLPLGDLNQAVKILGEKFSQVPLGDEIIAVPMGPKTHVLATLMVAQDMPRVTCLHPRGSRDVQVQVRAVGTLSCWRARYS